MTYRKEINPVYYQVGKRKRITGYLGELFDGNQSIHDKEYKTYHAAEVALDKLAFELLTDLAEQGLIDELPTFEPSTCCFCSKPHSPQSCPEMRALLFAPDATICECGGCGNDPDTHYGNLEELEARRIDELEAAREVCFDQYGIASDLLPCPDCKQAVCECDIGSDEWNRLHQPLDVDFAPTAWSD